ncbi:KipI family sensor histidine kinase inhibitor [Brevibacterium sanguinis]|uniref:KipI family sensor histidine kinase inhibitor n=2 Tax=Brevibacterium TaxID=1696 RepID=A0A366INA2_9MICO|nr:MULTISPECIES: urea amidolyase family protein [Brevibacterium]RBP68038.1 KipI family sensor histidine kinase inhibitor [Brevibacterium sanguinis]RBP74545.1 KipI family sensor histidine kinase inhibitor [Brevibacterium celere]
MTRFRPASRRDLLVECDDLAETMRLHAALEASTPPGVDELIPAARTVLIRFDPRRTSARRLREAIGSLEYGTDASRHHREVRIDVSYDGEDLAEVADLLDVSPAEVVRRHQAATWRVAFAGFAPGFGYLAGDDPLFSVPRRPSPRTRVPVGAVALAGEFTGVYPRSSPGGWQLIGHTDAVLWDLDRDPPALFVPGTIVTFRDVGETITTTGAGSAETRDSGDSAAVSADGGADASVESARSDEMAGSGFTVEVVEPGLQLLVEDLGRPGFAAMGVSQAGAADRGALITANRLVGNDPDAAGLESYGGAVTLRLTGASVAAVTGAPGPITLTSADGTVFHHRPGEPFATESGDELHLGTPSAGVRRYVAFRGGLAVESALESRSSDTLAHLGPDPLQAGDTLPIAEPATARHLVAPGPARAHHAQLPAPGRTIELEVTLGPRDDWFTSAGISTLLEQTWTVTSESDRVGLRLQGDVPLERSRDGELPSEGAVTGALQVPPNGQPVLFGPDHPLTGGYPIIAGVDDTDLAAQLPPGARVRFVLGPDSPDPDASHSPDPEPDSADMSDES